MMHTFSKPRFHPSENRNSPTLRRPLFIITKLSCSSLPLGIENKSIYTLRAVDRGIRQRRGFANGGPESSPGRKLSFYRRPWDRVADGSDSQGWTHVHPWNLVANSRREIRRGVGSPRPVREVRNAHRGLGAFSTALRMVGEFRFSRDRNLVLVRRASIIHSFEVLKF